MKGGKQMIPFYRFRGVSGWIVALWYLARNMKTVKLIPAFFCLGFILAHACGCAVQAAPAYTAPEPNQVQALSATCDINCVTGGLNGWTNPDGSYTTYTGGIWSCDIPKDVCK